MKLERVKTDLRTSYEGHDNEAHERAIAMLDKAVDPRLREIFYVLAGKVGAAMENDEAAFAKLADRLDFGPPREYPIKLPDGVVYESPGSTTYPKDHVHARMSAALQTLAADSEEMCERIEAMTGHVFVGLRMKKGWTPK